MLPPALSSSYSQYKQDTNSVAAWLASTAKAYGHAPELLQPPVAISSSRLKGKARAQEQERLCGSPASASLPKYIIKIKDFVPLAEFIAQTPQLSVPASFIATLDRVIGKRIGFPDKLERYGIVLDKDSDTSHGYFIGILEKVRSVLQTRMVPTPTSAEAQNEHFSNRFTTLELQEPSEEFLNAPDVVRPSNAEGDNATYEMEQETEFKDLVNALSMIIGDLNRIRLYVKSIWSKYKSGFFELTAAAIATNTAIDLGRNLTEDLVPSLELHGGIGVALGVLFELTALRQGHDIGNNIDDDPFSENTRNSFTHDLYDLGQETFISTFTLVDLFRRRLEPGILPTYNGNCGCYDASSDRKTKSGHQKFMEDHHLLFPFFTELVAVVRVIDDYPVQDEFMRGMKEMDRTKEVPFYLVFAAQIFLDMHHTIREYAKQGFVTFKQHLRFFDNELKKHFKFHRNINIAKWPVEYDLSKYFPK